MEREILTFKHKDLIDGFHRQHRLNHSNLSFSNLFLLDAANDVYIVRHPDGIIILHSVKDHASILAMPDSYNNLFSVLKKQEYTKVDYLYFPDKQEKAVYDSDNAEYIYDVAEFTGLAGNNYRQVRRKINHFIRQKNEHKTESLCDLSDDAKKSLWEYYEGWYDNYQKNATNPALISANYEMEAFEKTLVFHDKLNFNYFILYTDVEISGFVVSEDRPANTALIHFFKNNHQFTGSAEYLFHAFATACDARGVKQINFQQDLGITGLRQFKKSLRPTKLNPVYTLGL